MSIGASNPPRKEEVSCASSTGFLFGPITGPFLAGAQPAKLIKVSPRFVGLLDAYHTWLATYVLIPLMTAAI